MHPAKIWSTMTTSLLYNAAPIFSHDQNCTAIPKPIRSTAFRQEAFVRSAIRKKDAADHTGAVASAATVEVCEQENRELKNLIVSLWEMILKSIVGRR
jgi:hypothetical protein